MSRSYAMKEQTIQPLMYQMHVVDNCHAKKVLGNKQFFLLLDEYYLKVKGSLIHFNYAVALIYFSL